MSVRAATREDLRDIARLRPASFSRSQQPTEDHLVRYLDEVFFGNPWLDPELPSLVHEQRDGTISGFLGVIPRPWRMGETTLRGAAGTQLMVTPAQRGLAGIQLLQRFLKGPQDLVFSDAANDAARILWLKLGGAAPLIHSMQWRIPLRPARSAVGAWATGRKARLGRIARPGLAAVDAFATAPVLGSASGPVLARPAQVVDFGVACTTAAGGDLRPDYSAEGLSWLIRKTETKTGLQVRLHTFEGERGPAGACAWLLGANGSAQVISLTSVAGQVAPVIRALARLAHDGGAHTLEGRMDGHIGPALEGVGARISREGPWALVQAKSWEVRAALEGGRARASRFDGEWWTAF